MKPINHRVLASFLVALVLFPATVGLVDVALYRAGGTELTISYQMTAMGYRDPLAVFLIGFVAGGLVLGLPIHFWAGMTDPATLATLAAARDRIAYLERQLGEKGA